jgi:hypothetical protein
VEDQLAYLTTKATEPRSDYAPALSSDVSSPGGTRVVGSDPSRRDLVIIALLAIVVRIALVLATSIYTGWSLADIANLHDGPSYLRVAGGMLDPTAVVAHLDRRVFIGYPTLIALAGLARVPLPIAALAISWFASAVVAVTAAQVFADRRIGWALVFFPPSFLIFSSLAMSEASMLALVGVGLYFVIRREWYVAGAVAFGCAGLIRPVACFAVFGVLAVIGHRWLLERRAVRRIHKIQPHFETTMGREQLRAAILVSLISGAIVAAGFVALRFWRGDALEGVKIYASSQDTFAGQVLSWPFASLIMTPLNTPVPLWKVGYVWSYVLFVVAGCTLAGRRVWLSRQSETFDRSLLATVWLFGNTIFVLCTGSVWGFHYFDRHILAAVPALLWAYSDVYPKRWPLFLGLGALFTVQGFFALLATAT